MGYSDEDIHCRGRNKPPSLYDWPYLTNTLNNVHHPKAIITVYTCCNTVSCFESCTVSCLCPFPESMPVKLDQKTFFYLINQQSRFTWDNSNTSLVIQRLSSKDIFRKKGWYQDKKLMSLRDIQQNITCFTKWLLLYWFSRTSLSSFGGKWNNWIVILQPLQVNWCSEV